MSIILSIDPGYDRCGVAIVQTGHPSTLLYSTCVITAKKDLQEKRLYDIYSSLLGIIKEWKPEYVAIETLFFSVNKKTAIKVAEARGVVLLLAGMNNLPLIELSPQEVKLAMAGAGNADKKQVQKMVELTLKINISGKLDDEIDAISLGFAAAEDLRIKKWQK